jgi:hypothetical protein
VITDWLNALFKKISNRRYESQKAEIYRLVSHYCAIIRQHVGNGRANSMRCSHPNLCSFGGLHIILLNELKDHMVHLTLGQRLFKAPPAFVIRKSFLFYIYIVRPSFNEIFRILPNRILIHSTGILPFFGSPRVPRIKAVSP